MSYILLRLANFRAARIRELDLTVEEVKRIRDAHLTDRHLITVRDIFMLSYYLGGINLRDLLDCRFAEGGTVLKYARHKTRRSKSGENETAFSIQPEARTLIERYRFARRQAGFRRKHYI